jgi:hypothetical protein
MKPSNRQHRDGLRLEDLDRLLARIQVAHCGHHAMGDVGQSQPRRGQRQILHLDAPAQAALLADDEQFAQAAPRHLPQAGHRFVHRHAGAQQAHARIHQVPGTVGRIPWPSCW